MKLEKIQHLINKGRVKAIIKDVAGRRLLFGFERLNRRSRRYHVKHLTKPIDMATLSPKSPPSSLPAPLPVTHEDKQPDNTP